MSRLIPVSHQVIKQFLAETRVQRINQDEKIKASLMDKNKYIVNRLKQDEKINNFLLLLSKLAPNSKESTKTPFYYPTTSHGMTPYSSSLTPFPDISDHRITSQNHSMYSTSSTTK